MKLEINGRLGTPIIEANRIIGFDFGGNGPDLIAKWKLHGDEFPETDADEEFLEAPFSLVCSECTSDAVDGIKDRAAAAAAGWRDVEFTPEQMGQNYGGSCPACMTWEEQQADAGGGK